MTNYIPETAKEFLPEELYIAMGEFFKWTGETLVLSKLDMGFFRFLGDIYAAELDLEDRNRNDIEDIVESYKKTFNIPYKFIESEVRWDPDEMEWRRVKYVWNSDWTKVEAVYVD